MKLAARRTDPAVARRKAMEYPIYQVDAFTGTLFRGNPAAVVLMNQWPADEILQAIAAENNLSETAFVLPAAAGAEKPDSFHLRWFTPALEIDLCGHATLASADVLFRHGHEPSGTRVEGERILFHTRESGDLTVEREGDLLALDFPTRPARPVAPDPGLAAALGRTPREIHLARDLLAVFGTEDEVRELAPDFERLSRLKYFAVCVTAPGKDCDFVSRFFVPRGGIPEDPVTGSAHCTLVPYWSQRLEKKVLHALQVSARGGELFCEDRGERTRMAGRAVEYLEGRIRI
jgi:predicted PhzF superfamily epimerase YddE/YHI9